MLEIIRQTPTQGPHHYSEINSNVNLPKVLLQKALSGLFLEIACHLRLLFDLRNRYLGEVIALSLVA
jgi:hypothetical protein